MTELCPDLLLLERLASGGLSAEEVLALETHVSSCTRCDESLEELRRNDHLAANLRDMDRTRRVSDQGLPAIDGYLVQELIHRGGQGLVFQAVQESTQRNVAVKLLLASSFLSPRHRRRFLREIELVAHLNHPHIVILHDSGETREGLPFFAMELLPGGPLTRALLQRTDDVRERLRAFLPVCDAVSHAHQRGVLHRDLKPGNVLLDEHGQAKVLDFGLAKPLTEDTEHSLATREGEFVGTLAYASPESFQGDPDLVDVRSDVYSLGVMLYELLTGTLPFRMDGTLVEVAGRITDTNPERPSHRNPQVSPELDAIVMQAMAREPERRYPGVGSLGQDLDRFLRGLPVMARADSGWYLFRKALWRHRLAVGALAIVFLAMMTGAVVSFLFWQEARDQVHRKDRITAWYRQMIETPDPASMGPDAKVIHMLEAAAADFAEHPESDPEIEAALAYSIGQTYSGIGLYVEARPFLERSVELFQVVHGTDHLDTLSAQSALARSTLAAGDTDAAAPLIEKLRAHADRERDDDLYWQARALEANWLYETGELDEAEAKAVHWHADALQWKGPEHPRTSIAAANLCTIWISQGRYEEAEELLRERLRNSAERDRFNHTFVLLNLAQALSYQGKDAQAEGLLLDCLERRIELYGPDHDHTNRTRNNLALLYLQQRRFQEAEPLILDSLQSSEERLGRLHPATLILLNNLAAVRRFQGRRDETETLLREVVEGRLEASGAAHPDTWTAQHNLGYLLFENGEIEEAEALLQSVWDQRAEHLGEGHAETLATRLALAQLLGQDGAKDEAIEHLEEIVDLAETNAGRPSIRMTMLAALIRAYLETGQLDEAEQTLDRAEQVLTEFESEPERERRVLDGLIREVEKRRARGGV